MQKEASQQQIYCCKILAGSTELSRSETMFTAAGLKNSRRAVDILANRCQLKSVRRPWFQNRLVAGVAGVALAIKVLESASRAMVYFLVSSPSKSFLRKLCLVVELSKQVAFSLMCHINSCDHSADCSLMLCDFVYNAMMPASTQKSATLTLLADQRISCTCKHKHKHKPR